MELEAGVKGRSVQSHLLPGAQQRLLAGCQRSCGQQTPCWSRERGWVSTLQVEKAVGRERAFQQQPGGLNCAVGSH